MARLHLRLLVATSTSQETIERMLDRLGVLHRNKRREDIEVIVWDGKKSLASYIALETRLYADPMIGNMQTGREALADWARNWRQVSAEQSAHAREKRHQRPYPLYTYTGKGSGRKGNQV